MRSTSSACVQLLLGESPGGDVPALDDDLANRLALRERLLGDARRLLVAEVLVERGHDRRRALGVLAQPLDVGGDAVDTAVGEQPRHRGKQPDRLEQVAPEHRQHDVELEVPRGATPRHRGVVADDLGAGHERRLGDDRVHLPRHDRRARLEVRQVDLAQPRARARAHPAQVVGDLRQSDRDGPQLPGQLDEAIARALRLEVVAGLGQRQARAGGELRDHAPTEAGRRVDAGADGRPAQRQLGDAREGGVQALDAEPHLRRVATELLAERDRRRVHEVRAARLHDIGELGGLALRGRWRGAREPARGRPARRPWPRRGSTPGTCRSTTSGG